MMKLRHIYPLLFVLMICVSLTGCTIKDDFPAPTVNVRPVNITAFEIEGQCDETGVASAVSTIDKDKRTVDVYVNDQVDIRSLRILSLKTDLLAKVQVEGSSVAFTTDATSLPKIDFSGEVTFVFTSFQQFRWKIRVHQLIQREVKVGNMVGNAIVDPINRNVIVYVAPGQKLSAIRIEKLQLGGEHGHVTPDPVGQTLDFTMRRRFMVTYAWGASEQWEVYVYNAEQGLTTTAKTDYVHSARARISGVMPNDATPVVQYRQKGTSLWKTLGQDAVHTTSASSYEAEFRGLIPGASYECQVTAAEMTSELLSFMTVPAIVLENGSFDNWSLVANGKQTLYNPWAEGATSYWDTGNRGATTVGASNSTYLTEGGRTFANLLSKYIVIKFAAGNIFTGTYLKTDGTNGILGFGRPFKSFPTKMRFDFRYKSSPVNRPSDLAGKWDDAYARYIDKDMYMNMKNQPDSFQVYIALIGDKDEEMYEGKVYPYVIRTRPSELHLFNPKSDNVIGYGQYTCGDNVTEWTTHTIDVEYRYTDRTPKYIIVVASSSKYGDYFLGGEGTLLQLDNMKLLYE